MPDRPPTRRRGWRVLAIALLLAAAPRAWAQSDDAAAPAPEPAVESAPTPTADDPEWAAVPVDRKRAIEAAIELIKADAGRLPDYKVEGKPPHLTRPHPAVSGWTGDMAGDILKRMSRRLTGNDYQDTFIRWHLMWVIREKSLDHLEGQGRALVKLVDAMPPPVALEERPQWYHDPEEVWQRYWSLYNSARAVIGIPPYEKRYDPPESFKYMEGERLEAAQTAYAQALDLQDQFKTITDYDAIAYNKRIRFVNWVVRQYRGELIYALMWTGDPQMAQFIMRAIDRHARRGTGLALDLLNFLYQASFDGALERYDQQTRNDMSRRLEQTARATESWQSYGGQERNFADYAFHMTHMLRDEVSIQGTQDPEAEAPDDAGATPESDAE